MYIAITIDVVLLPNPTTMQIQREGCFLPFSLDKVVAASYLLHIYSVYLLW